MPLFGHSEYISGPLSIPIPPAVSEIELSYVGEHTTPAVTLSRLPAARRSLPYRPIARILDLRGMFGEARAFGSCQGQKTRTQNDISL